MSEDYTPDAVEARAREAGAAVMRAIFDSYRAAQGLTAAAPQRCYRWGCGAERTAPCSHPDCPPLVSVEDRT